MLTLLLTSHIDMLQLATAGQQCYDRRRSLKSPCSRGKHSATSVQRSLVVHLNALHTGSGASWGATWRATWATTCNATRGAGGGQPIPSSILTVCTAGLHSTASYGTCWRSAAHGYGPTWFTGVKQRTSVSHLHGHVYPANCPGLLLHALLVFALSSELSIGWLEPYNNTSHGRA